MCGDVDTRMNNHIDPKAGACEVLSNTELETYNRGKMISMTADRDDCSIIMLIKSKESDIQERIGAHDTGDL